MSDLKIEVTTSGTLTTLKRETETPTAQTTGEFEQFEKLTRKLVTVPKAELDEKLSES